MKTIRPLRPPKPSKYIDLMSDYGFKLVFGCEPNKDLLIHFLNEIFKGEKHINDIQYSKNELHGRGEKDGIVIFDLLCTGDKGEKFLIEVQRAKQEYFIKRSIVYTSRLISEQIPRGGRKEWNFDISEVYFIAILENFSIMPGDNLYIHTVKLLCCENHEVFYDNLKLFFLELCNFAKDVTELNSDLDKWFYVLKNMSNLDKIPLYLRKPVLKSQKLPVLRLNLLRTCGRINYEIWKLRVN